MLQKGPFVNSYLFLQMPKDKVVKPSVTSDFSVPIPPQDPWELKDDFEGLKNILSFQQENNNSTETFDVISPLTLPVLLVKRDHPPSSIL